jgi:hypothetical protein
MFVTTFVVYLLFTITKGQESLKMESDFGGIHFEKVNILIYIKGEQKVPEKCSYKAEFSCQKNRALSVLL